MTKVTPENRCAHLKMPGNVCGKYLPPIMLRTAESGIDPRHLAELQQNDSTVALMGDDGRYHCTRVIQGLCDSIELLPEFAVGGIFFET